MDEKKLLFLNHLTEKVAETPFLQEIIRRAFDFLNAGFPVHFCGPAGVGKTTLAFILAKKIGRPVVLIHGNDEYLTSDLVGGNFGYRKRKVVDNYIHSVVSVEEDFQRKWLDGRLTTACKNGYTLIYDEFTRSRAEVNNILLSILEEKILSTPGLTKEQPYLEIHPNFRAIFTSNPEEYAGVHNIQAALADRMVSLHLRQFDKETEIEITSLKSGAATEEAALIVDLITKFRHSYNYSPSISIRSSIRIATVTQKQKIPVDKNNPYFQQICTDILFSELQRPGGTKREDVKNALAKILKSC